MKNLSKKYMLAALKQQNNIDSLPIGNEVYILDHFGTTWECLRLVSDARWQKSGFQKLKLTKNDLLQYLQQNNINLI